MSTREELRVPDLAFLQRPVLRKLLLLTRSAEERVIVDESGALERVSLPAFLFKDLPAFVLELLAVPPVLLGAYLTTALLAGSRRGNPKPPGPGKRVGYLRAHFFHTVFGGTLAHTLGVLEGFRGLGWSVSLLASDRVHGAAGIPTERVAPWRFFRDLPELHEIAYNARLVAHALRRWRKDPPDLIYQRQGGFILAGLALSRILGVPFVLEYNSSDYKRAKQWKERGYSFPHLLRWVESVNTRGADRVVVVSQALRDDLLARGVESGRILLQPNGVNPERFDPKISGSEARKALGIPPDAVVVGFCGTFMAYQGLDVLLKAAAFFKGAGAAKLRFLLIGGGGVERDLRAAVKERGLSGIVTLAGVVPFREVPRYLAACDILVSPDRLPDQRTATHSYRSPIKLFEYMAMGKAVVASRLGQAANILKNEEDALLVPPGDPDVLAQAIRRLIEDPAMRERLGKAAREKVVERHTWTGNVARIVGAFRFQQENRRWWNSKPMTYDWHGTAPAGEGTPAFFEEIDRRFARDHFFGQGKGEPLLSRLVPYGRLRGKRVLEVGCGAGSMAAEFARQGARFTAVDLSDHAVRLTHKRFLQSNLSGSVLQADAEKLPLPDASMDYVWSWGVLHHTSDTGRAVNEVFRVLKPGGTAAVMLYHKSSFRYWVHLLFLRGIVGGKLLKMSVQELVTQYTDGAVARHYTKREALALFSRFASARTRLFGLKSELLPVPGSRLKEAVLRRMPDPWAEFFLRRVGWFLWIEAKK